MMKLKQALGTFYIIQPILRLVAPTVITNATATYDTVALLTGIISPSWLHTMIVTSTFLSATLPLAPRLSSPCISVT